MKQPPSGGTSDPGGPARRPWAWPHWCSHCYHGFGPGFVWVSWTIREAWTGLGTCHLHRQGTRGIRRGVGEDVHLEPRGP